VHGKVRLAWLLETLQHPHVNNIAMSITVIETALAKTLHVAFVDSSSNLLITGCAACRADVSGVVWCLLSSCIISASVSTSE